MESFFFWLIKTKNYTFIHLNAQNLKYINKSLYLYIYINKLIFRIQMLYLLYIVIGKYFIKKQVQLKYLNINIHVKIKIELKYVELKIIFVSIYF